MPFRGRDATPRYCGEALDTVFEDLQVRALSFRRRSARLSCDVAGHAVEDEGRVT